MSVNIGKLLNKTETAKKKMEKKIKPCPRCGSKAKLDYVLDTVAVSCTNPECKYTGHACLVYTPWGDCPYATEDAIQLWNKEINE